MKFWFFLFNKIVKIIILKNISILFKNAKFHIQGTKQQFSIVLKVSMSKLKKKKLFIIKIMFIYF